MKSYKNGLTITKALPFHRGHELMIDYGGEICEILNVLVSGKFEDTMNAFERFKDVELHYEHKPNINVVFEYDTIPDAKEYDGDGTAVDIMFWKDWIKKINTYFPDVDVILSNDQYGKKLAELLDVDWCPVDMNREMIPISGTMIREDVDKHYHLINNNAKRHFQTVVAVMGAESTGKSTLIEFLSTEGIKVVREHGRVVSELRDNRLNPADFIAIAKGQQLMLKTALRDNRFVVSDTEAFTTYLFTKIYLQQNKKVKKYQSYLLSMAKRQHFDLYVVLAPTVEWVDDGTRTTPKQEDREMFFNETIRFLNEFKRNYVVINYHDWNSRNEAAINQIKQMRK